MDYANTASRKNPSRETCEGIIRRILMTEILENGKIELFEEWQWLNGDKSKGSSILIEK